MHASAVGTGFIPVLPATDKIQSKCLAAARVGINPTPTVDVCCNQFDNPLIAKVLHTSAVGTGFIPVLPATDKIQSKCPAAARAGLNPTPTLGKCDQCMNMYAKQTSRMISPSGSGASAGKGFMPFLKQCSTYFPSWRWCFFISVGTFFEGGHEALPCSGCMLHCSTQLPLGRGLSPSCQQRTRYKANTPQQRGWG